MGADLGGCDLYKKVLVCNGATVNATKRKRATRSNSPCVCPHEEVSGTISAKDSNVQIHRYSMKVEVVNTRIAKPYSIFHQAYYKARAVPMY